MSFISDNGSGRIAPQRLNSRGPRTLSWPGPTEGPGVRLIWWQGRGKQPAAWLLQVGQLERVRAFERACVRAAAAAAAPAAAAAAVALDTFSIYYETM